MIFNQHGKILGEIDLKSFSAGIIGKKISILDRLVQPTKTLG
jgi:hypothetical protein